MSESPRPCPGALYFVPQSAKSGAAAHAFLCGVPKSTEVNPRERLVIVYRRSPRAKPFTLPHVVRSDDASVRSSPTVK